MVAKATTKLLDDAAKPLAASSALRNKLIEEIKKSYEQTNDTVSRDLLLAA